MRTPTICIVTLIALAITGCGSNEDTAPPVSDSTNAPSEVTDGSASSVTTPTSDDDNSATKATPVTMSSMTVPAPKDIKFKDDVRTNVSVPKGLDGLVFIDTNNQRVKLSDYLHKKHVVLVFTEGFAGMLCPFCKTQTARLVANYDKFKALDAEILVVYPGERDHVDEFIEAAQGVDKEQVDDVPFRIVLDEKMEAVDYFDIRSRLAHPSTYVIDKQGKVQLAYVGNDMTPDRPSIKALLQTLEAAEDRTEDRK